MQSDFCKIILNNYFKIKPTNFPPLYKTFPFSVETTVTHASQLDKIIDIKKIYIDDWDIIPRRYIYNKSNRHKKTKYDKELVTKIYIQPKDNLSPSLNSNSSHVYLDPKKPNTQCERKKKKKVDFNRRLREMRARRLRLLGNIMSAQLAWRLTGGSDTELHYLSRLLSICVYALCCVVRLAFPATLSLSLSASLCVYVIKLRLIVRWKREDLITMPSCTVLQLSRLGCYYVRGAWRRRGLNSFVVANLCKLTQLRRREAYWFC